MHDIGGVFDVISNFGPLTIPYDSKNNFVNLTDYKLRDFVTDVEFVKEIKVYDIETNEYLIIEVEKTIEVIGKGVNNFFSVLTFVDDYSEMHDSSPEFCGFVLSSLLIADENLIHLIISSIDRMLETNNKIPKSVSDDFMVSWKQYDEKFFAELVFSWLNSAQHKVNNYVYSSFLYSKI